MTIGDPPPGMVWNDAIGWHWPEGHSPLQTPVLFLTEKLAEKQHELSRLQAENERLRKALKPLAKAADNFRWVQEKGLDIEGVALWSEGAIGAGRGQITVGDALRAANALQETEKRNV